MPAFVPSAVNLGVNILDSVNIALLVKCEMACCAMSNELVSLT
jgi:hypothetical protein